MRDRQWQDYFYSEEQLACAAIAVRDNSGTEFIGSAAYLAPGLFVTAKHVIEDPLAKVGISKEIYENRKYGQLDGSYNTNKFKIEAVHLLRLENKIAQRWPLEKMSFSHDFDFAIASASTTDGPISNLIDNLPIVSVNIHPIPFKFDVVSYGFFGKSTHIDDSVGTDNHDLTFQGRKGKLVNLHLDIASVAGPVVYEADNKIEHMMSGGPTFNHEGSLLGVNSAGLESSDDVSTHRSIITPLIRAMYMNFEYWMNGSWQRTSLYELATKGVIEVIGYEHLSQNNEHIVWSPNPECDYCKRGLDYHNEESSLS